jgi:hypothetical protein
VKLSWLAAVAVLVAGLAACGTQSAAGGQSAANSAPLPNDTASAAGATAGASATVTPVRAAGSASAGTASAAPAITVPGPQPTPASTPLAGPVTLTAAARGAVVYLRVGQQVTVILAPGFQAFHQPRATGTALRPVSASGGYPGQRPARAVFRAVAPGTATLSAVSDTACLHAHPPCMVPQQTWTATVHVSG